METDCDNCTDENNLHSEIKIVFDDENLLNVETKVELVENLIIDETRITLVEENLINTETNVDENLIINDTKVADKENLLNAETKIVCSEENLFNAEAKIALDEENMRNVETKIEIDEETKSVISDVVFVKAEDEDVIKPTDESSRPDVSMPVENIHSINLSVISDDTMLEESCLNADDNESNGLNYFTIPSSNLIEVGEIPISHEVAMCVKIETYEPNESLNVLTDSNDERDKSFNSYVLNLDDNIVEEIQVKSCANSDSNVAPLKIGHYNSSPTKHTDQKVLIETSVRRSSRIQKKREKEKQKNTSDKMKKSKVLQKKETLKNTEMSMNSNGICIGKQTLSSHCDVSETTNQQKLSKCRGRPKKEGKQLENKTEHRIKKEAPCSESPNVVSCNAKTDAVKDGHEKGLLLDCKIVLSSANDSSKLEGKSIGVGMSGFSFPNKKSNVPSAQNVKLSNISSDSASKTKATVKGDGDEQSITKKPEKVKSRWRRSCEKERELFFEHGELVSGSAKTMREPHVADVKTSESPRYKKVLTPILEETSATILPIETPSVCASEMKAKAPQFELIEDNIYRFERKRCKSKKEVRRMLCDCTLTKDELKRGVISCDDDCLNRLLMIE